MDADMGYLNWKSSLAQYQLISKWIWLQCPQFCLPKGFYQQKGMYEHENLNFWSNHKKLGHIFILNVTIFIWMRTFTIMADWEVIFVWVDLVNSIIFINFDQNKLKISVRWFITMNHLSFVWTMVPLAAENGDHKVHQTCL